MQDHAARSDVSLNAQFSKLDWLPTEYVRSAHRALVKSLFGLPRNAELTDRRELRTGRGRMSVGQGA
jgi:hypothetical protein